MTRLVGIKSQLPLAFGALLLVAGCSFEPPGSVLNNTAPPRADGGVAGGADADIAIPSTETLTFTFTSSPITPPINNWDPNNVVATWIEDAAGAYVATIDRQGNTYFNRLVAWTAVSGPNNQDAISGATRLDHNTPVVVTWAIPGNLANGIYTIRVETADDNTLVGNPDGNNQGTFTFDKNGIASNNIGLDGNGYTGITIDYAVAAP